MTALTPCGRCDGTGRIANTDEGEPWSAWESLPPGSDLAVRAGLVKPVPCPDCSAGAARAETPDQQSHPAPWGTPEGLDRAVQTAAEWTAERRVATEQAAGALQTTVEDVQGRRTRGITVPVRVDLDERSERLLSESRRRDALHAAALAYRGQGHDVGADAIVLAAADFEAYLRGDEVPTPVRVSDVAGVDLSAPGAPLTVAGFTFEQLYALGPERAEQLARRLDVTLAEGEVDDGQRSVVRAARAILRRQR